MDVGTRWTFLSPDPREADLSELDGFMIQAATNPDWSLPSSSSVEMSGFKEHDVVELVIDLKEHGLKKGDRGTIIYCFSKPDVAYEVEFSDKNGQALAQLPLKPDQITSFWSSPTD